MGLISEEDINRVRDATDAVAIVGEYVQLRQRGSDFWGCCPFHGEKTPSFKVSSQTQFWHCFGCGEGGDIFKFLMKKEQFEFPEAVRYLAAKAGIFITEEEGGLPSGYRSRLLAICEETAKFYNTQLMRGKSHRSAEARKYLGSRNLGGDIPKKWNIGYAPGSRSLINHLNSKGFNLKEMVDANVALAPNPGRSARDRFYNRVMFPIHDLQGRTIAFGGRVIGKGEPKYINTSNCPLFSKRSNLYGIDFAKSSIVNSSVAIVVEGYTDVIAMHTAGFENTVATLGTALTPQHVKLLARFAKRVVYLFDGDAAGQKAADRASELITSTVAPESGRRQIALDVAIIPYNMDPAECIAQGGKEAMDAVLKNSKALLRFVLDRRIATYDLSTPENRALALPHVLEPLVPIRDSILADEYVSYLSDIFKVDFERIKRELKKASAPRNYAGQGEAQLGVSSSASLSRQQVGSGSGGSGGSSGSNTPSSFSAGNFNSSSSSSNAISNPKEQIQPIAIPRNGVGRWEAELLCLYALQPVSRMDISKDMENETWSNPVYSRCMEIMLGMPTETNASDMVLECISKVPESEPIWSMSLMVGNSTQEVLDSTKVMLRERRKASLKSQIFDLENQIKYQELTREQSEEIFTQIADLQKKLSTLRKN